MDKLNRLGRRRDAAFDEKNYYEAHQISRTIYNRLLAIPEVEASSVLKFLFETCVRLADVGEVTSALDLGELFVNTLINRVTDDGDVEAGRVLDEFVTLFSNCPPTPDERACEDDGEGKFDPLAERRNQLLNRILNWTTAKANAAVEATVAQRIKDSPPPQLEDGAAKSVPASETRKEAEMDLD